MRNASERFPHAPSRGDPGFPLFGRRNVPSVPGFPSPVFPRFSRFSSAVSDADLLDAGARLACEEGLFVAPEGAACVAAVGRLLAGGFLQPRERILIYNTGAGVKYLEAYSTRFPRFSESEQDKLGGLITPR